MFILQSILKSSARKSVRWALTSFPTTFTFRINRMASMSDQVSPNCPERILQIGDFSVFSWSISGIETTVVVKKPSDGFSCCFDMGYACRQNVPCDKVMISHGHMDHISAIPQHIKKRELCGQKPATYFVPPHLVDSLRAVCSGFDTLSENTDGLRDPRIVAVKPGDKIDLTRGYFVVPFSTVHRVTSQGYIVYSVHKKLASQYVGLDPKQISACVRNGENIHREPEIVPEIAFTGDTTFEVFTESPPPDLFKVKLLIVEATYINDDSGTLEERVCQARKWGHIHLSEIYENASLFKDVGNILLMHPSDKYSCSFIQKKVFENLPDILRNKIHVSTLAKERYL